MQLQYLIETPCQPPSISIHDHDNTKLPRQHGTAQDVCIFPSSEPHRVNTVSHKILRHQHLLATLRQSKHTVTDVSTPSRILDLAHILEISKFNICALRDTASNCTFSIALPSNELMCCLSMPSLATFPLQCHKGRGADSASESGPCQHATVPCITSFVVFAGCYEEA